jgi:two-component system LytT family response regulator
LSDEGIITVGVSSLSEALEAMRTQRPDTLILDLMLAGESGLDVLRTVRAHRDQTPIIIISALGTTEQRVKGLLAGADDYLVKPFSEARFAQAIARFLSQHKAKELPESVDYPVSEERSKRIVVRVKNEIKIIQTQEVSFFEAEDDYISIHTQEGKFLKKMTMKQLEESLDPDKFARVHRSFLVNLQQVSGLEPYEKESYLLRLRSGQKIPVSKSGYARLRQVLGL